MTHYHAQHDALFRAVAEIRVRDYIAPSETAETVAEWCKGKQSLTFCLHSQFIGLAEPSELAELIADVEGREKR